ncbi:MAG: 4-hydroxy-tetrahydrodipicolinate reductase [Dokdonella sp.]
MDRRTAIAVHGASGRMGQAILRILFLHADASPVAAMVRGDSRLLGTSLASGFGDVAADLMYTTVLSASSAADALIDFSLPTAFDSALACALERKIAFVSGTTGLDGRQQAALARASESIPVLWSANFSLGIALLARLVAQAARALPDWDCEIAEAHHSAKKDAPSGTALSLGREVATARAQDFDAVGRLSRTGEYAQRAHGDIGFAVTRAGDIVGEHSVMFATCGERIELCHRATDRNVFAHGAVTAACWISGRAAGRYSLSDVLDLATGAENA